MREQCYLNFWGAKGSNGKSTLLNLIRLIWGDYAAEAPESVVLKSAKNDARFDFQFLVGVRLVMKGDIAEGVWLNNENVKNLIGGDSFRAEKKYHDGFEFAPQCKVILSSNSRLRLSETGNALERRVRLVPFRADFRAQPDKDMPNKLRAEGPAILAILIDYARRWHERGLPESKAVTEASAEYILDEDVVRQFIAEKCVRGDGEAEPRAELYKAFTAWLKSNKPPSAKSFKDKMLSRGYDCKRNGKLDGLTCFFGLRLLREGEQKPPEQADLFAGEPALEQAGLTKTDELTEIPPFSESSYMRSEYRKVFEIPPKTVSSSVFASGEEKPPEQADFWTNPFDGEGG
jgi:putative DNA primase/helicase